MDTSWWPALAAVVVLALVAAVVDGWGRRRRAAGARAKGRRGRPVGHAGGTAAGPRGPEPGEIWWARVAPEEGRDGDGRGGERPCLVLAVRGGAVLVAEVTGKYHEERAGVIPLPPGAVGEARGRGSFLETDELRQVPVGSFRRRVGVVDPVVWDQVRYLGA